MRVRTRSACVVLAWGILLILVAVGSKGFLRSDQANIRIASSTTSSSITSNPSQATLTRVTMTSNPASRSGAAASAARPAPRRGTRTATDSQPATDSPADAGTYVVQPGDTLSGIAAALGTRGGWTALYAANRQAIGPDPDVIRAGTALALPGQAAPARYTVVAGDTLTGIAAALGTRGGWTALYAANRQSIGPDPDVIRAGTVLTIPPAARPTPASAAPHPGSRPSPPPATAPAPARTPASAQPPASPQPRASAAAPLTAPASARPSAPAKAPVPATGGLPRWLEIVLLAAGVLIGTAFLTEPVLAITRRRRPPARPADRPPARPAAGGPAACAAPPEPRILLADYDRLVVTCSGPDGTVCVLRPPGADPEVILLAARLVLAQDRYEELAGHLGVAAHGRRE